MSIIFPIAPSETSACSPQETVTIDSSLFPLSTSCSLPLRVENAALFLLQHGSSNACLVNRAHFRAASSRWQNCLVSNGAECFQLFLGGEFLGCERLLDSEHF